DGQLDRDRLDSDQLRYVNAAFVGNLARQLRRSTGGAQITSITQIQSVSPSILALTCWPAGSIRVVANE
ncbi:MAG TPA: hypothetical protein VLZ05_16565, partial [Mycobacterium sp.]